MRFSEIPSTARVRLEIAQRRVCTLFPFERKAADKNGNMQQTLDINVNTD